MNFCEKHCTSLETYRNEHFQGKNCEEDVNECFRLNGTDLGCQNGATCVNKPGTYEYYASVR